MTHAPTAASSTPRSATSVPRFVLTVLAWVLAAFGFMRLEWVQTYLLLPFARLQQQVATQLFGAAQGAVVVDLSCTGADAIALCVGVIVAFPAPWRLRLGGSLLGLGLIVLLNTARIGTLSLVANNPSVLNILHVYVWPALVIIVMTAFVFRWMTLAGLSQVGLGRPVDSAAGISTRLAGRFLLASVICVGAYFALAPWLFESAVIHTVTGWTAAIGAWLIAGSGVDATASGSVLRTAHGSFVVTPECVATPLLGVYTAAVLSIGRSGRQRGLALLAALPLFFLLGIARLLVLALPQSLVPSHLVAIHGFSQVLVAVVLIGAAAVVAGRDPRVKLVGAVSALMLAVVAAAGLGPYWMGAVESVTSAVQQVVGHSGHTYFDTQGAVVMLPAFQLGLLVGLWVALGGWSGWWRLAAAVVLLGLTQVAIALGLGELHHHIALDPHVGLLRAWALGVPVAMTLVRHPRATGRLSTGLFSSRVSPQQTVLSRRG